MNFQPVIDNLPMILAAIALLLWAAARFVEAKAKADPARDKWDEYAPKVQWAARLYSQAIDWLATAGILDARKGEKLEMLNRLVREFEKQWDTGNRMEAINTVVGYYVAARGKAAPFVQPVPQPRNTTPLNLVGSPPVQPPVGELP